MSGYNYPHNANRLLTVIMQTCCMYIDTGVLRHRHNNLFSGLQVRGDERRILRRFLRNRWHLNVRFMSVGTRLINVGKQTGGNSRNVS